MGDMPLKTIKRPAIKEFVDKARRLPKNINSFKKYRDKAVDEILEKEAKMIAYCGLNCSECDAYLATQNDDDAKRAETARNWSKLFGAAIEPEQINCDGCKSEGVRFSHCEVCEIRHCSMSKSVDNCALCESYICDTLSRFIRLVPEAGVALERLRS